MPTEKPKRWRRQYLVQKEMQYRYMGMLVVPVLVASAVMAVFLYLGHSQTIGVLSLLAEENERLVAGLQFEQTRLLIHTLVAVLFNVLFVGAIGFFEIHKMAGPIYRFTKTARQIATGSYPERFSIRSHDLPQELASAFQDMILHIRARATADLERMDHIATQLGVMAAELKRGTPDRAKAEAAEKGIQDTIATMRREATSSLKSPA